MNLWEALKKYFWIVHLIFLTLAAYLAAGIAGSVLHTRLAQAPKVDLAALTVPTEPLTRSEAYYQPILDRNIFDSSAIPSEDEEGGEAEASSLNAVLLGTIAARNEKESLAIIQDRASSQVDVYFIGDRIGGATVLRIERGVVTLQHGGREEVLTLPDIKTASAGSPSGGGMERPTVPMDGIVSRGETNFEVKSDVVANALEDMGSLMTQARIVPHMQDGQVDGFKIYNIKANSLFKQLGLRNGDVIHRVNGMDVSGPEQGLQVFEALRNEKNIQIDISRRGSRQTLNYTIR